MKELIFYHPTKNRLEVFELDEYDQERICTIMLDAKLLGWIYIGEL
jgi:hypothetical protein